MICFQDRIIIVTTCRAAHYASFMTLLRSRVLKQTHSLPPQLLSGTEVIGQKLPDGCIRQSLLRPIIDDVECGPDKRHPPNNPRRLPKPNIVRCHHQRTRGLIWKQITKSVLGLTWSQSTKENLSECCTIAPSPPPDRSSRDTTNSNPHPWHPSAKSRSSCSVPDESETHPLQSSPHTPVYPSAPAPTWPTVLSTSTLPDVMLALLWQHWWCSGRLSRSRMYQRGCWSRRRRLGWSRRCLWLPRRGRHGTWRRLGWCGGEGDCVARGPIWRGCGGKLWRDVACWGMQRGRQSRLGLKQACQYVLRRARGESAYLQRRWWGSSWGCLWKCLGR